VTEATAALTEAVRRSTGATTNNAIRDRIFSDTLKFAESLSKKDGLTADLLELLYRHASDLAADPPENLSYRLTFAQLFEKLSQPERAVRLYQQILRDRTLRELPRSSGAAQLTGGSIAQSNIGWNATRLAATSLRSTSCCRRFPKANRRDRPRCASRKFT
jgi:hypothetical protein